MKLSREWSPGEGSKGEKMVAIFTLFCIVFIDSGNKHKILNKSTWKLPVWAALSVPLPTGCLCGSAAHVLYCVVMPPAAA